jgi:hypothetical protein
MFHKPCSYSDNTLFLSNITIHQVQLNPIAITKHISGASLIK